MCSVTDKERKGSFWKSYIAFSGFSRSKQTMSCVQWDCFCRAFLSPPLIRLPQSEKGSTREVSCSSVFPMEVFFLSSLLKGETFAKRREATAHN